MDLMRRKPVYCPILRAKRGEIQALGALSPSAKGRIRPMLDIPRQKESDKRDLYDYLCTVVRSLPTTWGTGHPIYLDMSFFASDLRVNGAPPVEAVFDIARQANLVAVPVTGTQVLRGPGPDYLRSVAKVISQDQRGVALRFEYSDLSMPGTLAKAVEATRDFVDVDADECDVFLDLEAIDRLPVNERDFDDLLSVVRKALAALSDTTYRNIVVCGSSIPEVVGKEFNEEPCRVDRLEFNIWQALMADQNDGQPVFGDSGITYPFQNTDNVPVQPPSRIRLSTSREHVLYRSTPDGYQDLRARVTREPPAISQTDSVGKRAIFGMGHGFTGEGGATDWVARDLNAHMESTLAHISRVERRYRHDRTVEPEQMVRQPWLQEGMPLQHAQLDDKSN